LAGALSLKQNSQPISLVLGAGVKRVRRSHPDIVDRIKYRQQPGIADEEVLGKLFEIPNVMVARSVYNTAAEGESNNFTYIVNQPSDYEPSAEELEYQRIYKLTDKQLCWAHYDNIGLGGEPGRFSPIFRQENPATSAEAFQTTGADSLIPAEAVLRARRFKVDPKGYRHLPRVLGVDVARAGGDKTRIVDRQGRKAGVINETMDVGDLIQVAHRVAKVLLDNPNIRKAYIDVTGLGVGVYDQLRNNGFENRVAPVNYGSAAMDKDKYVNRRAEISNANPDPARARSPGHRGGPSYCARPRPKALRIRRRWPRPTTRSCWRRSAFSGHMFPTSRRHGAGTRRRRSSAQRKRCDGWARGER
jgi:hypothetical protein